MNRLLYLGCTPGDDVKILQNDLNAVTALPSQKSALAPLNPDGIFGSKTRARVQEFQSLNGLSADGVVGPKSREMLTELLGEVPGAQATPATGGATPSAGQSYSGGPPYGKPIPYSTGPKSFGSGAGGGTGGGAGGGTGPKSYGGKTTGGGGGGSGGGGKGY